MRTNVENRDYTRVLRKKIAYVVSYLTIAIVMELTTFLSLGLGWAPQYVWLDIAVMFLFCSLLFMIPNFTVCALMAMFLLLAQGVVSAVNGSLYGMNTTVFTFSMIRLLDEAGDVISYEMIDAWMIALMIFYLAIEGIFLWKMRAYRASGFAKEQVSLSLLTVCCIAAIASLGIFQVTENTFKRVDKNDPYYIYHDDKYLWDTLDDTGKALSKFGTFGMYYKDIQNTLFPLKVKDESEIFQGEGGWNSQLQPYDDNAKIMTGRFAGKNLVVLTVETGEWYAINKEYTPTLYAMASQGFAMTNYYAKDKTNHSEAMSILGSYPLKVEEIASIKDHTLPFTSANVLKSDGYTANYFHANDGYFYKRHDTHESLYGFDYTHFLDTMPRLKGYSSYKTKNFYDFDRDSEMISQYMDDIVRVDEGDSAFFTMIMSLTSHGHFDDLVENGDYTLELPAEKKNLLSERFIVKNLEPYYEKIEDYPKTLIDDKFSLQVTKEMDEEVYLRYKRYQAGLMDLDIGLNRLLYSLEQSGELDNTVFFVYADHNCYYTHQQYNMKQINSKEFWNTDLFNIPFFIWSGSCMNLNVQNIYEGLEYTSENTVPLAEESVYNGEFYYSLNHNSPEPNIGGVRYDKFCNSLDLLPTLYELFGYDYNLQLFQGVSIFRNRESAFVSRESGKMNDVIYLTSSRDSDMYLMAEVQDSRVVSKDGQYVVDGNRVFVVQNGEFVEFDLNDMKNAVSVYSGMRSYIRITNTVESADYFSDSIREFLSLTVEYSKRQNTLESMYSSDYFKTNEISRFLKKL